MTSLLSMLDRFEQAAVTYETSTDKADRDELHAARRAIMEAFEAVESERDEAVNWSDIVERHGTDQFDDLAEAWLALPAINRITAAVTSVFTKWASNDLMERFRTHQLSMFHMAYVEGCLAGVKAAEARAPAIMEREAELVKALKAAMAFIDSNVADPDITDEMAKAYSAMQDAAPHAVIAKAEARAAIHPSLEQE